MAAVGTVFVVIGMGAAGVVGRALIGIGLIYGELMLVIVLPVGEVKMAVMEVVHVAGVGNSLVAAAGAVNVCVIRMSGRMFAGRVERGGGEDGQEREDLVFHSFISISPNCRGSDYGGAGSAGQEVFLQLTCIINSCAGGRLLVE